MFAKATGLACFSAPFLHREYRPTPILVSDAEREHSIALLRDAVGEGRLTLEEFSERVGLAQAARTDQQLARQARLAGPETALEVYNLFGTVRVIVPEGVEVVVRGGGLFASQKIESPERAPIAGGPRLTIDTRGPGGTLYVRTRPTRPTLKQSLKQVKRALNG